MPANKPSQPLLPTPTALQKPLKKPVAEHFEVWGDNQHSALDCLHEQTGIDKKTLKQAALFGAIWIARNTEKHSANLKAAKPQRLRRLKKVLMSNQRIDFYYKPDLLTQTVATPELIDDQQAYSVWLKPRGMLSQGSKWCDHSALYRWVELHYQKDKVSRQCWIVHRLDRATCGLMLLAHSKKIAAAFSQLFSENQIHKSYRALVWGIFPANTITLDSAIDNKTAISHVSCLKTFSERNISLVEINIESGRKHQIRKHLSQFGYPILGDRLYGNVELDQALTDHPDLQLSAFKLEFVCPLTQLNKHYQLSQSQLNLLNPTTLVFK